MQSRYREPLLQPPDRWMECSICARLRHRAALPVVHLAGQMSQQDRMRCFRQKGGDQHVARCSGRYLGHRVRGPLWTPAAPGWSDGEAHADTELLPGVAVSGGCGLRSGASGHRDRALWLSGFPYFIAYLCV
jgi:hypothetical protein